MEKVKLGGLFSSSVKVMYEIKYMSPVAGGDARSIHMFNDDGKVIGKLEYERTGSNAKIYKISIDDWSSNKYPERLLLKFIKDMKKLSVHNIETEIFDTDNKTHELLLIFKRQGFQVSNVGNVTGYNQYLLKRSM